MWKYKKKIEYFAEEANAHALLCFSGKLAPQAGIQTEPLLRQNEETAMQSISEIMTRDVSVVSPDNNVQWAAQVMRDRNIGALPVCNGTRIVGMLTDRDIVTRAVVNGKPASQVRVVDIMSGQVFWCFEDQTVGEVLQEMSDLQVRRIPVVSRDSKELVGIVSLGDLATRQDADVESTLEDVSSPIPPRRESAGKRSSLH